MRPLTFSQLVGQIRENSESTQGLPFVFVTHGTQCVPGRKRSLRMACMDRSINNNSTGLTQSFPDLRAIGQRTRSTCLSMTGQGLGRLRRECMLVAGPVMTNISGNRDDLPMSFLTPRDLSATFDRCPACEPSPRSHTCGIPHVCDKVKHVARNHQSSEHPTNDHPISSKLGG